MSAKNSFKRWSLVWYPESLPIDWLTIIKNRRCEYAYILHNNDIDVNGIAKKEHFHICLTFPTAVPFAEVEILVKSLNQSVACIEPLKSVEGMVDKYFLHLGLSDKAQYSIDEIVFSEYFEKDEIFCQSTDSIVNEVLDFIYTNRVGEFSVLVDNFRLRMDCLKVISNKTHFFTSIINSIRYEKTQASVDVVRDLNTLSSDFANKQSKKAINALNDKLVATLVKEREERVLQIDMLQTAIVKNDNVIQKQAEHIERLEKMLTAFLSPVQVDFSDFEEIPTI